VCVRFRCLEETKSYKYKCIGRLLAEADVAVVVPPLLLLLVALAALDGAAGVPVVVSDMIEERSRIHQ